jgi:hypothetical protein
MVGVPLIAQLLVDRVSPAGKLGLLAQLVKGVLVIVGVKIAIATSLVKVNGDPEYWTVGGAVSPFVFVPDPPPPAKAKRPNKLLSDFFPSLCRIDPIPDTIIHWENRKREKRTAIKVFILIFMV